MVAHHESSLIRLSRKERKRRGVGSSSARTPTLDYLGKLFDKDNVRFVRVDGKVSVNAIADFQSDKGGLGYLMQC
jgi:hypothetical protein